MPAAILPDAGSADAASRLFILDARHGADRKILTDWVHATWGDAARGGDAVRWVSLPIADGDDALPLEALASALEGDTGRLVVPLRVAWRIPDFETKRSLGLRQFFFGDPRNPGPLRARLILWRDRRRAQILMGEAATVADLAARFDLIAPDARVENDADGAFAGFVAR